MSHRLIVNPASGRGRGGRRLGRLRRLAARHGIELEESAGSADLVARAGRAVADGVERLLVAGGDGTWHWAAQGLAGCGTALAPIPLGTGNDLARELGTPFDLDEAVAAALAGEVRRIDLGRLGERWFCGVGGVGLDAAVADFARTRLRWLRGPLVYVLATLAVLARFRPPRVELEVGEQRFEGEVFFVAFANTSHYGGGMRVAPAADPADGLLDVVIVRRCSKAHLLRVFPRVYRGRHLDDPWIEIRRGAAASLRCDAPQPVNLDGESGGEVRGRLPAGVGPGALPVVMGPTHKI